MRITVAFCDLHYTSTLWQAEVEMISPSGVRTIVPTWACIAPGCHRHYRRDVFGYHRCADGENPQVGDYSVKPKCGWNHEVEFMVLTEIGGVKTWACPDEKCTRTQAFEMAFSEASA
jgi:hypothetical protein